MMSAANVSIQLTFQLWKRTGCNVAQTVSLEALPEPLLHTALADASACDYLLAWWIQMDNARIYEWLLKVPADTICFMVAPVSRTYNSKSCIKGLQYATMHEIPKEIIKSEFLTFTKQQVKRTIVVFVAFCAVWLLHLDSLRTCTQLLAHKPLT